jgi:type II secretory pathway component PulK
LSNLRQRIRHLSGKLPAVLTRERSFEKQRGVALFLVIVAMMLIIIILGEIVMASSVDTKISRNAIHRLQAYYLASSAAKLSLLRLRIFKEVNNQLKGSGAEQFFDVKLIDQIWALPLPPLPLTEGKETAHWPGKITAAISSESSKIPINLIDGNKHRNSSDVIGKQVKDQVEALINSFIQNPDFDKTPYKGMEAKNLVNPLVDWIDGDFNRQEGGDENSEYDRFKPPYSARNDRMPSISELHMIEGWSDDFVDRFGGNFTLLSYKTSVNPNQVSLTRIKSWGPDLTPEDLAVIDKRRKLSPFADLQDLESYVKATPEIIGARTFKIVPADLKSHSKEQSFQIDASGTVGDISRVLKLGVYLPDEYSPPPATPPKPDEKKPEAKLTDPQVIYVEEVQ